MVLQWWKPQSHNALVFVEWMHTVREHGINTMHFKDDMTESSMLHNPLCIHHVFLVLHINASGRFEQKCFIIDQKAVAQLSKNLTPFRVEIGHICVKYGPHIKMSISEQT